jgi:glutathione synthase/RimK-type ligase-like ATP-grasp enzyme
MTQIKKNIKTLLLLFLILLLIKLIIIKNNNSNEPFINLQHPHFKEIYSKYNFNYEKKDNSLIRNNNEKIKRKDFNSKKCKSSIINKINTINKFKEAKKIVIPFPNSIEYNRDIDNKNTIIKKLNDNNIKYPIVIKPTNETQGNGVYVHIKSIDELFNYIDNKLSKYKILQIQQMLEGENYRVLFLNGEIIDILNRTVPYVIGDGNSTIKELIDKRNKDRKKGTETKIITENYIKEQGYNNINVSVPNTGKRIYITKTINYHNGGNNVHFPINKVHKDTLNMFKYMMKYLDCNIGGIDYISKDLTKSFKESKTDGIIEINNKPYYDMHIRKNNEFLIANKIVTELDKYYNTVFK